MRDHGRSEEEVAFKKRMERRNNPPPTVHDTSYKLFEEFQLTTNRNDPSYRNWIEGRLKKINTEEHFISDFNGETFVDNYFMNIDPNQASSM